MTAPRPPRAAVWWAIPLLMVTIFGLAALDYMVLVLHGLTYGIVEVLGSADVSPPDADRYGRALTVGVFVDVVGTATMLWLLWRTAARQWPSWVTGLLAAAVAGVVATSALLLVLGINPLELLPTR